MYVCLLVFFLFYYYLLFYIPFATSIYDALNISKVQIWWKLCDYLSENLGRIEFLCTRELHITRKMNNIIVICQRCNHNFFLPSKLVVSRSIDLTFQNMTTLIIQRCKYGDKIVIISLKISVESIFYTHVNYI